MSASQRYFSDWKDLAQAHKLEGSRLIAKEPHKALMATIDLYSACQSDRDCKRCFLHKWTAESMREWAEDTEQSYNNAIILINELEAKIGKLEVDSSKVH